MLSILIPFAISILIVFVTLYIFVTIYNKRTLVVTNKIISQTSALMPTVLQNVKLRYWIIKHGKTQFSPNNYCDLYLFDNYLAIVRRQNFVFKVFFSPVLLTSDVATTKNRFEYLQSFQPDFIQFNQLVPGQVSIQLKDPIYRHRKIDITFKNLTNEQTKQLEIIKDWSRQL